MMGCLPACPRAGSHPSGRQPHCRSVTGWDWDCVKVDIAITLSTLIHAPPPMARMRGAGTALLSVVLCDDKHIRHLNNRFRGKDYATDVLSFEMSDAMDYKVPTHVLLLYCYCSTLNVVDVPNGIYACGMAHVTCG